MRRPSVIETLEETPPRSDSWTRWVLLALLLSVGIHAAFIWWARDYQVKTFSDSYYDKIVPRAFKVDRVEIDSSLLEDEPEAAVVETRPDTPAQVDLPAENIAEEKAEVIPRPAKPGQLGITEEKAPDIGLAAADSLAQLEAATAASFDEDPSSVREALLAETPSAAARPALELAPATGRPGAAGEGDAPAGYSDLDELLRQSGGLTASNAPIFMPSDVLFGYDEAFLRPEAVTSLGKLGELIRRSPQSRFRIEGHTDSFGGPEYNARLSLARAQSVKNWLGQNMGIDPARIDTRGQGSNKPLVSAAGTIEQQQLNRRVEIVILRADGGR
ncbi:MAG: OmpA family protein [Chthoniobacterales bacterium]|nr:OmpA family protein [Chthoniobacterales bacterium]